MVVCYTARTDYDRRPESRMASWVKSPLFLASILTQHPMTTLWISAWEGEMLVVLTRSLFHYLSPTPIFLPTTHGAERSGLALSLQDFSLPHLAVVAFDLSLPGVTMTDAAGEDKRK